MSWTPILDNSLATDARSTVFDIATALATGVGGPRSVADLVLFYAYACELDEERFTAPLERALADAAELADTSSSLRLWGGLAGVGFAVAHVNDQDDAADVLETIDDRLVASLEPDQWDGDYDLIGGLVGHAVYFLERLESSRAALARRALDQIVDLLASSAEATSDGMTWWTPPARLPAWQRQIAANGYYNCGVAHGIPGIIAVLGRIAALPDPPPRAGALRDEATRWLLARPRAFPAWVTSDGSSPAARTSWCYGDAGIAAALWRSAAQRGTTTANAVELAREIASIPPEHRGVDAGLCHGPAGIGHLMNRWYHASGDPAFRDAARRWFAHTLAMRRPDGCAGFVTVMSVDRAPTPSSNLLEGAIGIGLALIAALSTSEPAWDRMLLCDVPPQA